jgi:hypothetical protein
LADNREAGSGRQAGPAGLGSIPIIIAGLIIAIGLGYWVASTAPDFNTLALGEDTRSIYGSYEGDKIFCGSLVEAPDCLGPAHRRNLPTQVLWLGNSQLHAINQPKPADITAPVLLARKLRPRGIEVQAMSWPNGSLQEFYLTWLFHKVDRHIDVLVVPLFLDDTREGEIRDVLQAMTGDAKYAGYLRQSAIGRKIIAEVPAKAEDAAAVTGHEKSLQARSEAQITRWLESCCGFQTMRENARGQLEIQMFLVRNWLFNITAQSARPIIPDTYANNLAALDAMLAEAAADGTKVIAYIAPLRQDVAPPYRPADYAKFKADARAIAARHGATLVDIDTLVPGKLWGTKAPTRLGGAPELDFMHFQEPGHVAVESAIEPFIETAIKALPAHAAPPATPNGAQPE